MGFVLSYRVRGGSRWVGEEHAARAPRSLEGESAPLWPCSAHIGSSEWAVRSALCLSLSAQGVVAVQCRHQCRHYGARRGAVRAARQGARGRPHRQPRLMPGAFPFRLPPHSRPSHPALPPVESGSCTAGTGGPRRTRHGHGGTVALWDTRRGAAPPARNPHSPSPSPPARHWVPTPHCRIAGSPCPVRFTGWAC